MGGGRSAILVALSRTYDWVRYLSGNNLCKFSSRVLRRKFLQKISCRKFLQRLYQEGSVAVVSHLYGWYKSCGEKWKIYHKSCVHAQSGLTFGKPMDCRHQAPLSSTLSQNFLESMSIEPVLLSNHIILCCPLLLLSVFPSIRVFSNESALHIR